MKKSQHGKSEILLVNSDETWQLSENLKMNKYSKINT